MMQRLVEADYGEDVDMDEDDDDDADDDDMDEDDDDDDEDVDMDDVGDVVDDEDDATLREGLKRMIDAGRCVSFRRRSFL